MKVIVWLDVRMLTAVQCAMQFCTEWFSWRQRVVERVLIAGYGIGVVARTFHAGMSLWWLLIFAVVVLSLVAVHRKPDAERFALLMTGAGAPGRVFQAMVTFAFLPAEAISGRWLSLIVITALLVVMLLVALPEFGEPGKRRRAALDKVLDSFGRDILTAGGAA